MRRDRYPPEIQDPALAEPIGAPTARVRRALLVAVIAAVVAVSIVAVVYVFYFDRATVTGANWQLDVNGVPVGYLYPSASLGCACPLGFAPGAHWSFGLSVPPEPTGNSTLRSVAVDPPFTLVGVTPVLPHRIPATGTLLVNLTVQLPDAAGQYQLNGVIQETRT